MYILYIFVYILDTLLLIPALFICAHQNIFCALWFLHLSTILHIIIATFTHLITNKLGVSKVVEKHNS